MNIFFKLFLALPVLLILLAGCSKGNISFWGDGSPKREFLYSEDLADACLFAMDNFESAELINVGSGENVSIKDLSDMISGVVGYGGKIGWDTTRPNGTPNRPLSSEKIRNLGWKPKHTLREGLEKTYKWFVEKTYLETI